jgi:2-polyprenyl-3-methyl-5-hydroxy-6-metoxy-1,4-benzoquinol methylase
MEMKRAPSSQAEDVKEYFERIARRFDSYYREEAETGGPVAKIAHHIFRKPAMACRFEVTFEFLGDLRGKNILDVGCGSGIYAVEIALRGGRSIGVDVSQAMIDLAERNASEAGVSGSCRFQVQDIMTYEGGGDPFSSCLAIGFFDYIEPEKQKAVLAKLLSLVETEVIATFPKKWVPATLFRKIWFLKKKLDVYFFTRKQVEALVDLARVEIAFRDCRSIWTVRFAKR